MRRRILLAAGCGTLLAPRLARSEATEVDLLLVLAADVSQSMQNRDLRLQREGYIAALRDREVMEAAASGPIGAIAVAYVEWSGVDDQRILVPWVRIGDVGDAARVALLLEEAPLRSGNWTSISMALAMSRRLIAAAPFQAQRRVVDVSGDGENNHGPPAEQERDLTVAEGIVVNGLPILRPSARLAGTGLPGETALEEHYRTLVTGGARAFVLPAQGFESFADAIRRKLVMEIADLAPSGPAKPSAA
ncbi:DUF1194 domain-containing protein [Falsiroseomonas oryziterrae]|uniref:DUF1194 domain-containing protein n=1 Tax=Falsiroseomonas oryziterrae TaxID=2911368 RepID=UPI001F469B33|nr:DUF1194 domain-containing protein [Roseomonas sp. NPKOSM-4]